MLERRRIRRAFGSMLSADAIHALATNATVLEANPREGDYTFLAIQVSEDTPLQIPELVAQVIDLAVARGAFVGEIISSVVLCYFGVFPHHPQDLRKELIADIRNALGSQVRIVHAQFHGLFGNLGSTRRFTLGPIFPKTAIIFSELDSTDFGQAKELTLN